MKKLTRITTVPISLEKLLDKQLLFMKDYYEVTAVSSDKENLERVGKSQNIPVYAVEMTRKITPWQDLKALWQLYRYLKKEQPLIVHTHTPKAGTIGMIASKMAGIPHRLHTVAGLPLLEINGPKRKLLNLVEKITYSCATKIYPNSKGLKNIILQEGFCKLKKIKIIANGSTNGIDTEFFNSKKISNEAVLHLKKSLGIHNDDFVFVYVGRLTGDKGINELLVAFHKIAIEFNHIKLLLVGFFESELDPLHKDTLSEMENNKQVIFVPFQKDVRPYYAVSNVLVFPSYREGFPNAILEAGAMGLPSIVTNINGCNEIIEDSKNGILIPPKDSAALFTAMKKIISDTPLRNHLQQNARSMVVSRFEQIVLWQALLEEYQKLENHV
ncbi:glycosyltransferase family 4 protein [Flavobacterium granuli]|uniref:Glycosyltransferase involved in cell wall biosynthesis n=1 Tax=Flavobacterium granuli TaxID=280093 RepID=A0ABU1S537_9FLAO|nr:glycosyltransferase family 4 protein [Flavobacterium granuli]MDR6846145.1 glycosyltransferase involved in cell wall biosynthesis [Flavobacterium granuli]